MNKYMKIAYKEALKAYRKDEIPVGAVIVHNNKVVAKAHNDRQKKYNVLGHAEINAILKAEKKLKDWRLDKCEMYVTLEPCKMCQMIIEESRINKINYLISQKKDTKNNIKYIQTNDCNNIKEEYKKILNNFFKKLR